jgi:hypothetical protein
MRITVFLGAPSWRVVCARVRMSAGSPDRFTTRLCAGDVSRQSPYLGPWGWASFGEKV